MLSFNWYFMMDELQYILALFSICIYIYIYDCLHTYTTWSIEQALLATQFQRLNFDLTLSRPPLPPAEQADLFVLPEKDSGDQQQVPTTEG